MADLNGFQSTTEGTHYRATLATMENQLREMDAFEKRLIEEIAERNSKLQAAKRFVENLTKARNSLKEYLDSLTDPSEAPGSDD